VKRIKAKPDRIVFQMAVVEKRLLEEALDLYPLIPAHYAKLNRSSDTPALREAQQLLDEALDEQRRENRRRLAAFLRDAHRFLPAPDGFLFTLNQPELEWLLAVLNDIRVGSWLRLGSPETASGDAIVRTPQTEPFIRAMDLSGYFLTVLLGTAL